MSTVPRITSPYEIFSDFVKVDLPRSSEDFLEVAAINNFGILYSAGLLFNNRSVILRCEIDGVKVFEVNLDDLKDMFSQNDNPTSTGMAFGFDDSRDFFTFKPSSPVMFTSSIKFFAKAATTSSSRDYEGAVIEYTRE